MGTVTSVSSSSSVTRMRLAASSKSSVFTREFGGSLTPKSEISESLIVWSVCSVTTIDSLRGPRLARVVLDMLIRIVAAQFRFDQLFEQRSPRLVGEIDGHDLIRRFGIVGIGRRRLHHQVIGRIVPIACACFALRDEDVVVLGMAAAADLLRL